MWLSNVSCIFNIRHTILYNITFQLLMHLSNVTQIKVYLCVCFLCIHKYIDQHVYLQTLTFQIWIFQESWKDCRHNWTIPIQTSILRLIICSYLSKYRMKSQRQSMFHVRWSKLKLSMIPHTSCTTLYEHVNIIFTH